MDVIIMPWMSSSEHSLSMVKIFSFNFGHPHDKADPHLSFLSLLWVVFFSGPLNFTSLLKFDLESEGHRFVRCDCYIIYVSGILVKHPIVCRQVKLHTSNRWPTQPGLNLVSVAWSKYSTAILLKCNLPPLSSCFSQDVSGLS